MGEQGNRLKHFRFLRTLSKHSVDRTFKQLKSIIAVSEFQKSIFSKVSPTLPEITVVHNPVTPASHEQCSPELSNEFVWIGRMTDEKDPEIALIAAELANAKLNFVGDGPLSEKLRNASSSALFVGWKTPSEVCEIQKKSRALLMTSKCLETASLVVLECLAAGIPCIVPEKSAATSWVINGFNGLYFESGNAESLAKVISLMMDDNLCQQLGDNAYQSYWNKPFSEDSYIANLLEVYKKL
jgi:glycosyltransferase involved in cell wall biosynthesis